MSSRTLHERVEERNGFKFIRLKSDRLISFWDAMSAVDHAHTALGTAISRAFKLLGEDDYDLERLEWKIDHLESHIGAIRKEIERLRGVKDRRERIALLRNTDGRSREEAAAFMAKADELERRLESEGNDAQR